MLRTMFRRQNKYLFDFFEILCFENLDGVEELVGGPWKTANQCILR